MRVAYDLRPLHTGGPRRGIGVYTLRLLECLAPRLDELIVLKWGGVPLEGVDLPAWELPRPRSRRSGWLQDRLRQGVFRGVEGRVDLVHFTSPLELGFGWPTGRTAFRRVVTVHDLIPVRHARLALPGWRAVYRPVYRRLARDLRHADFAVTVSRATDGELRDFLGEDCPPTAVVPLAAGSRFHPLPPGEVEEYRRRAGLPGRFLLFLGGITPNKNLSGLLQALEGVDPAPPLVVAGAGRLCRSPLPSVIGLGPVEEEDLPRLYAAATALVVPSLVEGFGLPVLEAMACGTPVVCSRASSLPEVAGEAARFFDPRSPEEIRRAVLEVFRDRSLRCRLREAGLRRAAEFSWERAAERTLEAYQRALR